MANTLLPNFRIGQGYDLHRLVQRNEQPDVTPLTLGGVVVTDTIGTIAHSDGDVVLHALIDALLGAMALGDIGEHFPPSDERYKNASSSGLLATVLALPEFSTTTISNLDITVFLEAPKLKGHKLAIRKNLAQLLELELNQIAVKAKTMEGLGAIGHQQAVAASVSLLVSKCKNINNLGQ